MQIAIVLAFLSVQKVKLKAFKPKTLWQPWFSRKNNLNKSPIHLAAGTLSREIQLRLTYAKASQT